MYGKEGGSESGASEAEVLSETTRLLGLAAVPSTAA